MASCIYRFIVCLQFNASMFSVAQAPVFEPFNKNLQFSVKLRFENQLCVIGNVANKSHRNTVHCITGVYFWKLLNHFQIIILKGMKPQDFTVAKRQTFSLEPNPYSA